MKRQDKYPETKVFHLFNANPHNRITTDCVIRAICTALGQTWEQTMRDLLEIGIKKGRMVDDTPCYDEYLKLKGWVKHSQPRKSDGTKYTGREFCRLADAKKKYVAHIGGHHIVAIIGGKVYDTWDSTDGCIGNYWTKA